MLPVISKRRIRLIVNTVTIEVQYQLFNPFTPGGHKSSDTYWNISIMKLNFEKYQKYQFLCLSALAGNRLRKKIAKSGIGNLLFMSAGLPLPKSFRKKVGCAHLGSVWLNGGI